MGNRPQDGLLHRPIMSDKGIGMHKLNDIDIAKMPAGREMDKFALLLMVE